MGTQASIYVAVEGVVDESVARKLVRHVGADVKVVLGKNGKEVLRKRIQGYNSSAHYRPWFVLVDLDQEFSCPPALVRSWLPTGRAPYLCFRVVVRAVESWLLADARNLASFLKVAETKIPKDPEALTNPKRALVDIARRSRSRRIRDDMVPRPESGRPTGPAYSSRLIEFVNGHWDPERAARAAPSLQRTLDCLRILVQKWERDLLHREI